MNACRNVSSLILVMAIVISVVMGGTTQGFSSEQGHTPYLRLAFTQGVGSIDPIWGGTIRLD